MKKLIAALGFIGLLIAGAAMAQVYVGQPPAVALVCAYNSGGAPTPVNGQFYYIQCNSSGQIIVK